MEQTQKQIKKLIELNSRKQYPLIKLSMTELQVAELLYQKSKVFLSGDIGKQYLVSKIEISKITILYKIINLVLLSGVLQPVMISREWLWPGVNILSYNLLLSDRHDTMSWEGLI